MKLTLQQGRSCAQFTVGWFALLLYVGACSPLGLGLAALTGSLDPNHQLLTGRGEQGVRLILHHDNRCASHNHGLAAHALTLFAQPASAPNPDHILQFSSADTLKAQSQTPIPRPDSRNVLLVFHGGEFNAHISKSFASRIVLNCPPEVDVARLCLCSTVLLI